MVDEHAFGVLVAYYAIEDDEYGLEREEFVARFGAFREGLRAALRGAPLGEDLRAIDFGHAWYLEVADGDQLESPLGWAKKARALLAERAFETLVVVTYGGRWVQEPNETEGTWFATETMGGAGLVTLSHPSEPLRKALATDARARSDEEDDGTGWGPGLYLDVEAVEPLGIKLRNEPTGLVFAGAKFFRVGT